MAPLSKTQKAKRDILEKAREAKAQKNRTYDFRPQPPPPAAPLKPSISRRDPLPRGNGRIKNLIGQDVLSPRALVSRVGHRFGRTNVSYYYIIDIEYNRLFNKFII